ncbi:MAG: Na+/H+ antiporter NhaC family protein [Mobilicoccus sp.]|nr:Na+/H+ antiporter NhaC family protein [Mobilicoccus sp.]
MVEQYPLLTIAPPILAIALVLLTRKVLLSLGAGVLASAALVADLDPLGTLRLVWEAFAAIFVDEGALNTGYVYILVFCLILGVIAALVMMSGGTYAFARWAQTRIHTRRGAKILPAILGVVIFIDDYFAALAVGQVARPITDQHRVSRAKLAYIVDSTAAPVSVLAPFSSWGASIIGIMTPIIAASTLAVGGLEAFVGAALMNYYALTTLVLVWLVVWFGIEIGPMRTEERRALETGEPYAPDANVPGEMGEDLPEHRPGAKRALAVPFVALVAGVLGGIAWTGYREAGTWDLMAVLGDTDVGEALMIGGVLGLVFACYYYLRYTAADRHFSGGTFARGVFSGLRSMWPAVSILVFAWMLGDLIDQLGTGAYLGGLVDDAPVSVEWVVPLLFVMAGAMAFATGTSWGSFGLLLPIAGQIMNNVEGGPELLIPAFGAVLAGAVFGDHCSPISDTTILSSTGSGSDVITHVVTQLPYALTSAVIAALGYVTFAVTRSGLLGAVALAVGLAVFTIGARRLSREPEPAVTEA